MENKLVHLIQGYNNRKITTPEMPLWLKNGLEEAFYLKEISYINAYQKQWNEILEERKW